MLYIAITSFILCLVFASHAILCNTCSVIPFAADSDVFSSRLSLSPVIHWFLLTSVTGAIEAVVLAMRKFPTHAGVQRKAVGALFVLMKENGATLFSDAALSPLVAIQLYYHAVLFDVCCLSISTWDRMRKELFCSLFISFLERMFFVIAHLVVS